MDVYGGINMLVPAILYKEEIVKGMQKYFIDFTENLYYNSKGDEKYGNYL